MDAPQPPATPSQPPAAPPPAAPPPAGPPPSAPVPVPGPTPAAPAGWSQAPVPAAPGPGPGVEFAPHGGRLVAYIIDGFIAGIIVFLLALVLIPILVAGANSGSTGAGAGAVFIYVFIVLLVSVGYFPFFWARSGQTPGMKIFGLRVVRDADGSRIGAGTAIIRLIGLWISFAVFYIGILWILFDGRRRGWHDLLAGTVVVHEP